MLLELQKAASTFQRYTGEVIHGLNFIYTFIDDLLITRSTKEEHIQHLMLLFQHLYDYQIKINSIKFVFGYALLEFLSHIIDYDGIHPLPEKVQAIQKLPPPFFIKQLHYLLGLVNFYC